MEDLKLLYQSYVDKKLISDKTTFEQFSSASPKQLDLLYRSGVDGKLVSQKTDFNTFSSAWGEKKKESSEVSPSRPSEKPFASATSPKPPIQPTFRTEAPDVFGGVKPADRKAPEAPRDQLSPAAKAQVQARVARGEVAESEIAKREEPTTSAVVKSIAREDGLDRGSLYTDAAQSLIDVAINSGDLSSDQLDDKSNIESIFSSVALNRAQKNPKLSPEVERIQALMQSQNNAPYLQAQLQFAKSKDLDLKQKLESESLFAGLQQSVKGKILDSVPEGKKQDEEYLRKLETDLWLNEGIGMDLSGDKRFNDQNFAADAGLAFVRGARGLIKGIRSVVGIDVDEFGIPYEISDAIFSDTMRRNTTQFEQDFYDSLKDSEFSNAARIALNTTGESAPIMIAAGATALENPLASYALLSTLSAAQTYGDVKSEEWFKDLHPMAQIGYVGVSGAAEGLGELAGARTATRALRGLAVSATKEASEIALAQYFKGLIYRGTLNVSENYIGEGLTGATQYVNDAVARGTEVTLNGAVDAFKRNAAAGVGMALVISGPSFAVEAPIVLANKIGRNFEIKRIDSAIKKRRDELLQAPTVSDRKVIADDILKLTKQRDGEVKASIEYFDSMSPDDRATTYALSIQLDDMVQQRLNSEDEAARDILASNIMGVYNQIKEISQGYDTQKEAGVPGPVVEGEAPVEVQPVEGTVQEAPEAGGVLQVPVERGVQIVDRPKESIRPQEVTIEGDDLILRHGSPYQFEKFLLENIGTGEGNQAFGYGLYFTESSGIAKSYAKKLSDDKTGLLYTVRIKDGNTSNWLPWREPVTDGYFDKVKLTIEEQAQYQEYLNKERDDYPLYFESFKDVSEGSEYFAGSIEAENVPNAAVYNDLADALGKEKATEILKRSGYSGVVYNSNRGYGKAKNYVVFNPESIEIIETSTSKVVQPTTEVVAPIEATVFAAPFYDTKVSNVEEARAIRQTEPYVTNLETIRSASALFNVEIDGVDEAIGGFVNDAGDKIVEVSNIIRVRGTPEDVQNYAAFLATSSPETQEATIAATYVEQNSEMHNIDELTISVSDIDGAIEALKENDIYDFTINDSNNTITFLDFSKGADVEFKKKIGRFAKSLDAKNITNEEQDIRAIDSKYIGPSERTGILGQIQETLVQQGQTGTELYRQVEQAIARNQEFLDKTATPAAEAVATQEVAEQPPAKNKTGLSSEQVTDAVSAAERLAKRLGLSTKIVVHNSRKDFNDAMDEVSNSGSLESGIESGRFIPSTDEVHINLEDMTSRVPFHEVFHAAFASRFSKGSQAVREKAASEFKDGVLRVLRAGTAQDRQLAAEVEQFVADGGYTARESPEEFMAQTAGFIANSGAKISKSTMDKLMQWLNNFIGKVIPSLKVTTRGEFIDFMNSFSGAMFESSTDKSLKDISEEGFYVPSEPVTMPDLSEPSSKRAFLDDAPAFIKDNIANLKALAGRKIPFAVFYDNLRVGKSTLRNSVTGKESNRNLMGGFGYSQLDGVKFEDDGARTAVLAFTSEDVTARKLSEFLRKDGDLVPVAMQNVQTGHLGNIDVVLDMFDPVEGVISTAPALYAQQQTGKDSGPEFEAARDAAEQEILGAIKQSVTELAVKPEKNPKKKDEPTERVKIALKIEPMLNDIKTLDDWRDKILLGAWDSFGARGLFNSYMLQAKPSKVTKSTRETHKILHGKYGVPTIKEVQDGMTENSLSNAELGDVVKFITIDDRAVIYTTDAKYSDLPAEGVEKKSDKISYTLKYIGDKVTPHTSYPYIIAGKNDGFAPSYIDITEIFPDLKGKVKKSQSFYSAGRRSLAAPSGEVDATIAESSSMEALEPEKGKSLADIRKSYEKSITPKISPKTILEEAKKLMIDRQSRIKNAVLELGLRTAYDRIVNKAGASARANDKYRRAEKKIYSGLKESEIKTLDDIIFARRVIQIDSNFDKRMLDAEARLKSAQAELSTWRSSKIDKKSARAIKQEKAIREKISQAKKDVETSQRPKHPLGYQSENGVFELNQLKEKLGDEKYNDLIRRSDLYFDEFRSTLKDLFDAGLVTEQTYNELRTNNYQPRKFIEHVFDFNNSEFLIRDFGLSGEQIKAIGTGSTGDLVMSSRFLMGAYQLSASKRILSNRTNTAIAEAIGKKGANDWVRETGPDGVVDPGFVKVYYFVDGVQQEFQLRADLKAELDNSSALSNIDPRLSVALSIVSGAPLLKLMATRANPLFAFKNFPRDLGHILLFTNIYDKHSLPYATYLVLGDFIKGLKSSIQDTQDFQEYMDLGGGMDFISIQGRDGNFVSRGAISKTIDVIGKLGEWSEVGFRIGVYKRFKDDGIAAFEKNNDSKPTGEDLLRIKESAVAKAREIIDFSQGGSAVKAIDKFAPYLNAAFQGFRVAVTYIANNPKKFAGKFVQAQMGLLGLAFYNLLIADDDEMEDIPEHTRLMNFIIFLPFTRVDEDGKKRRKYILVPKAIDGTPFFALMDIANRKIINEVFGKKYSISKDEYTYMINGARKGLPIGDDSAIKELTSLVPIFNAAFTYQSGYDTFRDRMVSMDMGEVLPAYEGVNDPNVEQFYKVLGEINGWSPIRTKTAVEKIITSPSSSFIVGMSYGILDAVARQYPLNSGDYNIKTSEDKMRNLAEQTGLNLSKAFVRETDPSWGLFNQKETLDNIDMAAGTERARLRAKAKELALGTNDPVKMEKSKKEALKLAQEIQKKNPIDAKYFLQSFKSNLGEAPSSQQSVEIQYSADDKARAKKIKLLYNPQNREDYMKIMRDVRKETGYKISAKTFYEYETAYGKLQ